jgi:hypothetical protein
MIAPPKPPAHDELEALIKEARARQLRRRLIGAAGVAVAAALGLSVYALATGGAQHAATASGGGPKAAGAPCNVAAGWRLSLYGLWSEPTGQHTAPLRVTRVGSESCALDGYPKIVLLNGRGHKINFRYSHRGDMVIAARPPHVVDVAGNGSAYFLLNKYRCDYRTVGVVQWLRVGLPGVHGWLVLRLPRSSLLDYCPADPPSRTIAISPLVAHPRQATPLG